MAWRIEVAEDAGKELLQLDPPIARRIHAFLTERLAPLDDPRSLGEALRGLNLADGAATVARMKASPTDDDCFGSGKIREDGRKLTPAYLFEVKQPSESRSEWDVYKLIGTTPADEAFRPLSDGACPLVKA